MDFQTKIDQLREKISSTLTPLIKSDYVLLDVPYHGNIGDVLIWEGERDFLSTLPYKNIQTSSADSWCGNKYLTRDKTILLHGGGNFGDLWRHYHDFKLKIIQNYPNNRIVLFPQSVWYEDKSLIEKDADILVQHSDLHICARDSFSYQFLKKHFGRNNIYLVPDMAFFISDSTLSQFRTNKLNRTLYFKRTDKELTPDSPKSIKIDGDIHDWPTVERHSIILTLFSYSIAIVQRLPSVAVSQVLGRIIDKEADSWIRQREVNIGLDFISRYSKVVTTRLHALILSVLLHIPVEYIDNTTGKLSAYVDTWLHDLENVRPYGKD